MTLTPEMEALVEKVARAMTEQDNAGLRSRGIISSTKSWKLFADDARAIIPLIYTAGLRAGREEAASFLDGEANCYRYGQDTETSANDKLYRMGQKDACILSATAIRNLSEQESGRGGA